MREIRQSGSEGGGASLRSPYPYRVKAGKRVVPGRPAHVKEIGGVPADSQVFRPAR